MTRRITLGLSSISLLTGIWLIANAQHVNHACSATTSTYRSVEAGAGCTNAVSSYLMGCALTAGSSIILVLILLTSLSRQRSEKWRSGSPTIPKNVQHRINTGIN